MLSFYFKLIDSSLFFVIFTQFHPSVFNGMRIELYRLFLFMKKEISGYYYQKNFNLVHLLSLHILYYLIKIKPTYLTHFGL
jgi:hypothetical protein